MHRALLSRPEPAGGVVVRPLLPAQAAAMTGEQVLAAMGATDSGLVGAEVARRRAAVGPNAVRTHRAQLLSVILRQLRSPLLLLLAVTAAVSFVLSDRSDALIIGVILILSVGLGAFNEYRAERAAEALHDRIRHRATVIRGGAPQTVDVTELVPGDIVELRVGELVPADVRLLAVTGLQCDESMLTGESEPADKIAAAVGPDLPLAELDCCAMMGTVVGAGRGHGVVIATGADTVFGRIAVGLGHRPPETEFQVGLRKFSMLLVYVAGALTTGIFVINVVLQRPILDALLFSLAIAVGISPQLLPAVVSTGLADGSRRLAHKKVLVKRLVCIEDLGDIEVLFTDKTGTLTAGRIEFMRALGAGGTSADQARVLGMMCTDAVVQGSRMAGGDALDTAMWEAPGAPSDRVAAVTRIATLPFDHDRRLVSVLADTPDEGRLIVTKGAPEAVLARCADVGAAEQDLLAAEFAAGHRVVAVATRTARAATTLTAADEADLTLRGLLVFLDPPKESARHSLQQLAALGVTVKVVTGDNPVVAQHVCTELGLPAGAALTGPDIDRLDDDQLIAALAGVTVFARVDPEQKARIVRAQRRAGLDVAFLGDGVNDALALHSADVGISVDSATDVAKDAADVVLLEKDLQVLADGVVEGRRIFANTMKYVLMGTSSNFGNMFSAAGASVFLPFLPMLPSQILLNNLLYDTSQLAIPTDAVDSEQLARPSRWDIGFIRRFMLMFGPISSIFDFATFGVMLWVFHAGAVEFHTGWFVESLSTQTLVLFIIRTRRSPFFRSRPSVALTSAVLGVVAIGTILPVTPLGRSLGFVPLPGAYFFALALMIGTYLGLAEMCKRWFFRLPVTVPRQRQRSGGYRVERRAARFSVGSSSPASGGTANLVRAR